MQKVLVLALISFFISLRMSFSDEVIKDGMVKTYHENGKIGSLTNYKNGKEDGISILYDEDGLKRGEFIYKDGKSCSDKELFADGQVKTEHVFKDCKGSEMSQKDYYVSGKLFMETLPNHQYKFYYPIKMASHMGQAKNMIVLVI